MKKKKKNSEEEEEEELGLDQDLISVHAVDFLVYARLGYTEEFQTRQEYHWRRQTQLMGHEVMWPRHVTNDARALFPYIKLRKANYTGYFMWAGLAWR